MTRHRQHRLQPAPLRTAVLGLILSLSAGAIAAAADARHLAVVELFTSQGCSSCPPANANLARIAGRPDVIALSFGVTYWDHLGWKDRFASPQFTQRQWAYARSLHHDNVWTPQIVVNGMRDLVGADAGEVDRAVASAVLSGPAVALTSQEVRIAAAQAPAAGADVWLARFEPGVIQVPVKAGENVGRTLPHRHVVRSLVRLGGWTGQPLRLALPPGDPKLSLAVWVQTAGSGPILGAASVSGPG